MIYIFFGALVLLPLGAVLLYYLPDMFPVEESRWTYEVFPDDPHR